jgi:hypothetical protein
MNKICIIAGMSLFCSVSWAGSGASSADQDISWLKGKIQGIEGRMDELERVIKEIKIKGKFEDLPLKQPNITNDELLNWVTDALVTLYSYNYLNIQQTLNKSRPFFTDNGYDSFMKALEESKNLDTVKNKKLVVNAIPLASATVVKEGEVEGFYTWQVELPLEVTYQGANNEFTQKMNIHVDVVRQNYNQAQKGIAINAITAKLVSSSHETKPEPSDKPTTLPKEDNAKTSN